MGSEAQLILELAEDIFSMGTKRLGDISSIITRQLGTTLFGRADKKT